MSLLNNSNRCHTCKKKISVKNVTVGIIMCNSIPCKKFCENKECYDKYLKGNK